MIKFNLKNMPHHTISGEFDVGVNRCNYNSCFCRFHIMFSFDAVEMKKKSFLILGVARAKSVEKFENLKRNFFQMCSVLMNIAIRKELINIWDVWNVFLFRSLWSLLKFNQSNTHIVIYTLKY